LATTSAQALAPILTTRIFKQVAVFLREMSNDNSFAKCHWDENLTAHIQSQPITVENVDFHWNLVLFHMNVVFQKKGITGVHAYYKSMYAPLI
jgi:hypothetical protein